MSDKPLTQKDVEEQAKPKPEEKKSEPEKKPEPEKTTGYPPAKKT